LLNHTVEAAQPLQPDFGTPDHWIRDKAKSRRIKTDKVDYWEGALQLLFYKLGLKRIDHSSRSIWGLVVPDLDFGSKNVLCPTKSLNHGWSINFVL